MKVQTERLDGAAKVLVVAAKKPLFPEVTGNAVVVSDRLVRDDLFTSAPVFVHQVAFHNWREGRDELSRDIPGLPVEKAAEMLAALDRRGIITCGSTVRYGDLLVGKVSPINPDDLTDEEKMLHALFGRADRDKNDESLYYRLRDPGVACKVELLAWHRYRCASCGDVPWYPPDPLTCRFCNSPLTDYQSDDASSGGGVMYVVKVDVVIRRKLCAGDVLRDGKGNEFTVARIVRESDMPHFEQEGVDVLVAADSSVAVHLHRKGVLRRQRRWFKTHGDRMRLEKVTLQSSEKMVYRGWGPQHWFTYLPTSSDTVSPGQKVNEAMLKALVRDGYRANAREMLSIKADSPEGRTAAYEALVKGESVSFGMPDTTTRLWAMLKALCFVPRLLDGVSSEVNVSADAGTIATSLALQGMSTAQVRALSFGQVKSANTFNNRTRRAEKDGLFCERIFGPERDWECICGKYRGMRYKGMLCDKCGVKVAHSRVQRGRFGHIELAMPVVHPWYINEVSDVLGLTPEMVEKVLSYDEELDAPLITKKGPLAIKECLEQKGVNTDYVVLEAVPVLPAGLRPLVLKVDGNWYTHDCTDLYRRVINRSNRLAKLLQLDAPLVIIESEHRMLQGTVAALFANEVISRPVLTEQNNPLHSLRWELTHLLGQVCEKRVDYSGKMVAIPNPELQHSTVGVPVEALYDLYQPLVIKELKARGPADTIRSAMKLIDREPHRPDVQEALARAMANRPLLLVTEGQKKGAFQPVITKGEALQFHPDDASRLGVRFAGEQVMLHLPLSYVAIAELCETHLCEDMSSTLLNLNPDNLPQMVLNQSLLALKPLDKIILGIGQ